MKPPECCRALNEPATCEHKDRYLAAEAYVKRWGFHVYYAPAGASGGAWKVADCLLSCDPKEIRIWPTACQLYGWDFVTSALIHEFGHCELHKATSLCNGLEAEMKANDYGERLMLPELIPVHFKEHRALCLQTHMQSMSKEEFLKAFNEAEW